MKKALLLVNLGTPDKPEQKHVRKYLSEFLNDPRVIDLPWLSRKILVNLIIVPFRSGKSTSLYKKLWTPKGSPLLFFMNGLVNRLNEDPEFAFDVYGAMRYGNPSITSAMDSMKAKIYCEIVILPLFPQYASSTTGSVLEKVYSGIRKWNVIPTIKTISQFYDHEAFVTAFAEKIRKYGIEDFDHIIFSYHGLPLRHIQKIHPNVEECACMKEMPIYGKFCYQAACYATSRLLAEKLSLEESSYSTCFQSRLNKNWLSPFTDQTIIDLAKSGKKKVLVAAPSFVADCLETIVEIGGEYNRIFRKYGGEKLVLVESLNDDPQWIKELIKRSETVI